MIYLQMFFAFFEIGILSFGGGYAAVPLIQSQIVEKFHWLDISQFADLITIAEATPGPLMINSATFVGQQLAGFPGAIICTLGCVFPAFVIVLLLSFLYMRYRSLKPIQGILTGLRPAVVAMIASAALSLLVLALFGSSPSEICLENFRPIEAALFCLSLFLLRKKKANAVFVIFGSGIAGTLFYLLFSAQ